VSALLERPDAARFALTFAHGAGAGMEHAFMESACLALAARGVATLRYQFPYTEAGKRRPDPPRVLHDTVRAACATAAAHLPGLPLFAGGKSMGGRMTSQASAIAPLAGVRGLVFFGFPLHPAGESSVKRADHLREVREPMLFLQGDRDDLADLALLTPILDTLPLATLHVLRGADHGFAVLKRSGRTADEVLAELAERAAEWMAQRSSAPTSG
jgi:uncharacterized protein